MTNFLYVIKEELFSRLWPVENRRYNYLQRFKPENKNELTNIWRKKLNTLRSVLRVCAWKIVPSLYTLHSLLAHSLSQPPRVLSLDSRHRHSEQKRSFSQFLSFVVFFLYIFRLASFVALCAKRRISVEFHEHVDVLVFVLKHRSLCLAMFFPPISNPVSGPFPCWWNRARMLIKPLLIFSFPKTISLRLTDEIEK